ncbi:hypothetical protein ACSNOH_18345, partial [Streptomyces sp. URMC 127]|uniref:hypothetical protein n=1 Tax=Streptomyces sp. URMC 127 TaxID=3423402 RepID=UPI003F1AE0E3
NLNRLPPAEAAEALTAHAEDADPYETWLTPHLPAPRARRAHLARLARAVPTWHLAQPLHALPRSADLLAHLAAHPGGLQ